MSQISVVGAGLILLYFIVACSLVLYAVCNEKRMKADDYFRLARIQNRFMAFNVAGLVLVFVGLFTK